MNNINLRRLLLKFGISSNLQGYHYILDCINILSNQQIHTNVSTLYEWISKKYGKNATAVERAIRHAKNKAWEKGTLKIIYCILPDNADFLYDLYFNFDVLENEMNKWLEKGEF